jgi:ADP-ribose pyrophosphatase
MDDMHSDGLEESTLDSEQVFRGVLLDVRRDRVRLPDGGESVREYIRHPGAVVVIAVDAHGRMVFERQFRYPLARVFLELPAGKIEPGEDIEACARRELREETGYEADEWQHLGVFHPCIGYSDERIEVFLARGLHQVGRSLDDEEFLEVLMLRPDEVEAAIGRGDLTDGKTLSALHLARIKPL